MTYAYLKKYSPSTNKSGFYIDGPNWTLQTSFKTDQFFRKSISYHDDVELPLTLVKTLVYLHEAETEDRTSKSEVLNWFPRLNSFYCEMSDDQLSELQDFIIQRLDSNFSQKEKADLNEFLRAETPLKPIK